MKSPSFFLPFSLLYFIIPFLLFVSPFFPKLKFEIPCEIVHVIDGDTLIVRIKKKTHTLRLSLIDAPEKSQLSFKRLPIGMLSKSKLEELTKEGNFLCHFERRDRYKRVIGHLLKKDPQGSPIQDISFQMVLEGEALISSYAEFESEREKIKFIEGEMVAKLKRRGFWSDSGGFMAPSLYRKNRQIMASQRKEQ